MIPKSKLTSYYDKKNNTIVIDDGSKWTTRMLHLLKDVLGLADLHSTTLDVVQGQLSFRGNDLSLIPQFTFIGEEGKVKFSFTTIQHIHNKGVCKISHSDAFNSTNDGIMIVTDHSRVRGLKNTRHLEFSRGSFGYYIDNQRKATLITSGSYITKADASKTTVIDPGTSIYLDCGTKLAKYAYDDIGTPGFRKLSQSKQLQLRSVDWIGNIIHPPKDKLKDEIVKMIKQGVEIPNNLGTILCTEMKLTGPELQALQQLVARNTPKHMCYR